MQIMKVKVPLESSKDTRDQVQEPAREFPGQTATKNERITVETQINHAGEVNKARYMP